MVLFNLAVHVLSGAIVVLGALCAVFPGLVLSFAALLFRENPIGLVITLFGLAMLAFGVLTLVWGIRNKAMFATDMGAYRAMELKLCLGAAAFLGVVLLGVLAYNSFSLAEVHEYGFDFLAAMLGGGVALNLVSCFMTLVFCR